MDFPYDLLIFTQRVESAPVTKLRHGASIKKEDNAGGHVDSTHQFGKNRDLSRQCLAAIQSNYSVSGTLNFDSDWGFPFFELSTAESKNPRNLFASLSHTDDAAAAAIGSFPSGIDVEINSRSIERVVDRLCSPDETELLRSPPIGDCGTELGPIWVWTAKEAIAKATGLGMRKGLKVFQLLPAKKTWPMPVRILAETPIAMKSPAIVSRRFGEYVISICSEQNSLERLQWESPVANTQGAFARKKGAC